MEHSRMVDLIGPMYDEDGVATVLGVEVEDLVSMRADGVLLGMETSDGLMVHPVFQFTGNTVDPRLAPIIRVFRGAPGWSAAVWIKTAIEDLDGLSPLDWIRNGHPAEDAIRLAGHTAGQWA